MTIEFQGGRLHPKPESEAPRLKLGNYLTDDTLPRHIDYLYKVTDWPMYYNDRYGDCTCAAAGHMIQAWSAFGQGNTITVDAESVLKTYEDVTGFTPTNPATDKGAYMQDVLSYWRKSGIEGHHILAFAKVDHTNQTEVVKALAGFGTLYLGINFPQSAMDQFNREAPWDVVPGSPIEGGHAINAGYYDLLEEKWKVITWGREQPMTQAFFSNYVEEAWAVISPEWLSEKGLSPQGLDLYALGRDFEALTGEPNPFPDPNEPPAPPSPPQHSTLCQRIKRLFNFN